MAVIASSARYGSGLYGTSKYGVVNLDATLTGVSATGAIGTIVPQADSLIVSDAVSATGFIGEINAFITASLTGVSATGAINTVSENVSEKLDSVSAIGSIGATTQTAVVFNFQAVKDQYSRSRTVKIPRAA